MNKSEIFTVSDIAKECGVKRDSITRFLTYCKHTGIDMPLGNRGFRNRYEFTEEQMQTIVHAYKNKTHGEMAEFNKNYWWGKTYRKNKEERLKNDKKSS